ncbi:MAG: epoxyqueuosine reductase QueH, partial [Bacteroidales bacterium]|nr:epoxyqueuosine reductase QueH [Bacteroidales bacterium]
PTFGGAPVVRGGTVNELSGGAEQSEAFPEGRVSSVEQKTKELIWWGQNWRKGGLQERRNALIKSCALYNQTWCGCEFSRNYCAK